MLNQNKKHRIIFLISLMLISAMLIVIIVSCKPSESDEDNANTSSDATTTNSTTNAATSADITTISDTNSVQNDTDDTSADTDTASDEPVKEEIPPIADFSDWKRWTADGDTDNCWPENNGVLSSNVAGDWVGAYPLGYDLTAPFRLSLDFAVPTETSGNPKFTVYYYNQAAVLLKYTMNLYNNDGVMTWYLQKQDGEWTAPLENGKGVGNVTAELAYDGAHLIFTLKTDDGVEIYKDNIEGDEKAVMLDDGAAAEMFDVLWITNDDGTPIQLTGVFSGNIY